MRLSSCAELISVTTLITLSSGALGIITVLSWVTNSFRSLTLFATQKVRNLKLQKKPKVLTLVNDELC